MTTCAESVTEWPRARGGYDVGASNVALAGVVEDIASIGAELPTDFAAAKTLYTAGANLMGPTLQKFAKAETGTYTAGATYTAYNSLFPPTGTTMWDDLIAASLGDTLGTAHTGVPRFFESRGDAESVT